jgi:hypothetical protein
MASGLRKNRADQHHRTLEDGLARVPGTLAVRGPRAADDDVSLRETFARQ